MSSKQSGRRGAACVPHRGNWHGMWHGMRAAAGLQDAPSPLRRCHCHRQLMAAQPQSPQSLLNTHAHTHAHAHAQAHPPPLAHPAHPHRSLTCQHVAHAVALIDAAKQAQHVLLSIVGKHHLQAAAAEAGRGSSSDAAAAAAAAAARMLSIRPHAPVGGAPAAPGRLLRCAWACQGQTQAPPGVCTAHMCRHPACQGCWPHAVRAPRDGGLALAPLGGQAGGTLKRPSCSMMSPLLSIMPEAILSAASVG